jgi:hypothetical protein
MVEEIIKHTYNPLHHFFFWIEVIYSQLLFKGYGGVVMHKLSLVFLMLVFSECQLLLADGKSINCEDSSIYSAGMNIQSPSTTPTLSFILSGIEYNDNQIKSLEAKYNILLSEGTVLCSDVTWGKVGDKEYINYRVVFDADDPSQIVDERIYHDGKITRTMSITEYLDRPPYVSGVIREPEGNDFLLRINPWSFFGGILSGRGLMLSEILNNMDDAKVEKISDSQAYISGTIYLIDGGGVRQMPEMLRVVIDMAGGFRPVLMETYVERDNELTLDDENDFRSCVHIRVSDIQWQVIDEVYVPIKGTYTVFNSKIVLKSGVPLTELEVHNLGIIEGVKYVEWKDVPMGVGPLTMVIDWIKVNEDLPDDKFVLHYPAGALVHDTFIDHGYYVGTADPSRPDKLNLDEVNIVKNEEIDSLSPPDPAANKNASDTAKTPMPLDALTSRSVELEEANEGKGGDTQQNVSEIFTYRYLLGVIFLFGIVFIAGGFVLKNRKRR